jgi:hypothetical protein
LTTALKSAKAAIMPATNLVCIYNNLFAKTAVLAGMQRKLPRKFCIVKANKRPVIAPSNAVVLQAPGVIQ